MKSPGRKATAKSLSGKRRIRPRWTMKGDVPEAIQCDLQFYRLFCESKELEYATEPEKVARFQTVIALMRRRWAEVMAPKPPPKVENPADRLLKMLRKGNSSYE